MAIPLSEIERKDYRKYFRHIPCSKVWESTVWPDGVTEDLSDPYFTPGEECAMNCGVCMMLGLGSFNEINRDNTVQFYARRVWKPKPFDWFATELVEKP